MKSVSVWTAMVLVSASLAAAQPAPDAAPLPVVRSWVLSADELRGSSSTPPTHSLHLELAIVSGTRWKPDEILEAVRGAAKILDQCGIRVDAARLREFDGPPRYRYLRTPDSRELARRSGVSRPAVFFVDDTLQRPAFDAEAIGRGNAASRPEMRDSVWITAGIRDLPVALAHELVHVLADSGAHSDAPDNLMREETTAANTRLAAGQCSAMRATGEANGLLERAPAPARR
ncbi:MAG: hypothetical protein ABI593_08180 [Betaproteobacteria bacterium]